MSPLLQVQLLRLPVSKPPFATRFPPGLGVGVGVGVFVGVGVGVGVWVGVGVGVFVGVDVGVGVLVGVGVGVGVPPPELPGRPFVTALSKVSPASSPSRENIIAPARPLFLM